MHGCDAMRIKAVIFDMDGVLIDAKEWHYESLNRALAPYQAEISRWDHIHTYDGLPTRVKLEMLTKAGRLPRELQATVQQKKQEYLLEIVKRTRAAVGPAFVIHVKKSCFFQ